MTNFLRSVLVGDRQFLQRINSPNRIELDLSLRDKSLWLGVVVVISILPACLAWLGLDFGTPTELAALPELADAPKALVLDGLHRTLRGSFVHTLLEWSAFCTASFTALLAVLHVRLNRDTIAPLLGIALFYAGCMDAFHTLAADRLLASVADSTNLIPFSWGICRLFTAIILLAGSCVLLAGGHKRVTGRLGLLTVSFLLCGAIAYGTIWFCVRSPALPQTMFPDSIITRPWDVMPLLLFALCGLVVFPKLHRQSPSYFSWAIWIGTIPQITAQTHMAFGSTALFDSNFNVAHFLKIVAYGVPLAGVCASYLQINADRNRALRHIQAAQQQSQEQAHRLETLNQSLEDEAQQRLQIQATLEERNRDLNRSEQALQKKALELERTLTKLQDTQGQLIHTEKMSSLGRLVAGLAHEINNPVNFIHGNLSHAEHHARDLLMAIAAYRDRVTEPDDKLRELEAELDLDFIEHDFLQLLGSMREGSQRMRQLVLALRTFSRLDEAQLKPVDLHEGIDSTLALLQHRFKYPVYRSREPDLPEIQLDRGYGELPIVECWASQINQVLMDLLTNALDAIDAAILTDRDRFFAGTKVLEAPVVRITTQRLPTIAGGIERIGIAIGDNGCGIDATARHRLFDPFFTTKPVGAGAGLGLSVADRVVSQHAGRLTYESELGQGTTFYIELPTRPPAAPATEFSQITGDAANAPSQP